MTDKDQQAAGDFLKALWELLHEFYLWVRNGWHEVAERVAGLEWKLEITAVALLAAVVVMPLVHAWITKGKR